jgi:ABC-2 type transport system permease protein
VTRRPPAAPLHGLGAVLYKEVRHLVREPTTLAMVIILPLMQLVIYGYAINLHVQHVPTVYYSESGQPLSQHDIQSLEASGDFRVVGRVTSRAALMHALVANTAQIGFVVPQGYATDRTLGIPVRVPVYIDGSDLNVAQLAHFGASEVALALEHRYGAVRTPPSLSVDPIILFNPGLRTPVFLLPALIGLVIQNIGIVLVTLSIIGERERGTLEQVLVTPIGPAALLLGKLIPYAVVVFGDLLGVLALMRYLFGVPIAGNVGLLLFLGAGFLVTSLGLGLLISTYARSQHQAAIIAAFFLLTSFLLSGVFFDINLMPPIMQAVSHVLPLTYFIQVLRGIINRGAGLEDLWVPAAATFGLAAFVLAWATLRFARLTAKGCA